MNEWLEKWIEYCYKNDIWWSVCADGTIDSCTWCSAPHYTDADFEPDTDLEFGTKEAYEWLVHNHIAMIERESE